MVMVHWGSVYSILAEWWLLWNSRLCFTILFVFYWRPNWMQLQMGQQSITARGQSYIATNHLVALYWQYCCVSRFGGPSYQRGRLSVPLSWRQELRLEYQMTDWRSSLSQTTPTPYWWSGMCCQKMLASISAVYLQSVAPRLGSPLWKY